jgi:hypothetical protein
MSRDTPRNPDAVISRLRAALDQRASDFTVTPAFAARVRRLRRRRRILRHTTQAMTAAAVIAVLALAAMNAPWGPDRIDFVSPPAVTPSPTATVSEPAPSPSAEPSQAGPAATPAPSAPASEASDGALGIAVPQEARDAPEAAAARAFIEAIDEQDFSTAWELLGPRSQDALGSQEALEADRTAFSEGWGAWAHSPDVVFFRSAVLATSGEGRLSVVTLTGTVSQEGVTGVRTVAVPAWTIGDSDDPADGRFEPFAQGDVPLTIEDPVEEGTVACDDVVIAAAGPMEYDFATASVDGAYEFTPDFDTEHAEPGRIVFPVDAPLSPGEHIVTFAIVTAAGQPHVDAVRFTVEGPC